MKFRFRDFCTLNLGQAAEGTPLPFLFSDALNVLADTSENKVSLVVTIDATYSGYLLNDRVYPGRFVRDHRTWGSWVTKDHGGTSPYDKPILTHHKQTDGDPIGRVVSSQFVQLWKDDDKFTNDYQAPVTDYVEGSGKIIIDALITDPEAQARILDGRYLTFSSGQTTTNAWCSICKHDAKATGAWCEHVPGVAYEINDDGDMATAYLITGYLDYLEGSFVNIPANSFAKVTSIKEINQRGREVEEEVGLPESDRFSHHSTDRYARVALLDSKGGVTELIRPEGAEDHIPYGKDNVRKSSAVSVVDIDLAATKSNDGPKKDFMDAETFAEANVARSMFYSGTTNEKEKLSDRILYGNYTLFRTITSEDGGHRHVLDLDVNLQTGEVHGYTSLTSDESPEHFHTVKMKLDDLNALKKGVKGKTGAENAEEGGHTHKFSIAFGSTEDGHEEFLGLEDFLARVALLEEAVEGGHLTDSQVRQLIPVGKDLETLKELGTSAKLVGAARKNLESSHFCGPGRSIPAFDSAHVVAARKMVGLYKAVPVEKANIMASVNRRAQRLGTDKGMNAATGGVYALFLTQTEKEMSGKKDEEGTPTPPAEAPKDTVTEQLADSLKEQKDQNKELQGLADSRQAQLDTRTEELAEARTDLRKAFASQLALARMLTLHSDAESAQDAEGYQTLVDSYAKRTIESLQDSVKDVLPSLQAVAKKLTDGKASFLFDQDEGTPPVAPAQDPTNQPTGPVKDESASPEPTEEDLETI